MKNDKYIKCVTTNQQMLDQMRLDWIRLDQMRLDDDMMVWYHDVI